MANELIKLSLDEAAHIVAHVDEIAAKEGTSRAAIIRRAIRSLVFSTTGVPNFGIDHLLGNNHSKPSNEANEVISNSDETA